MNHFTFNGHSTSEFGLLVTGLATYGSPARRVEKISVPGRNGDVLLDEGTFDNYIARYQIAIIDNFKVNARAIANWLLSSRGYSELTDTYNPETYRMASFYSNIDYVVTALSREGTASIEFDCKPQRYFYTNAPITFTANAYTGTLDIGNIPNTAEAPLSLSLKGNTKQTGKNLIDDTTLYHGYFGSANANVMYTDENYRTAICYLSAGTYTISTTNSDLYRLRYAINDTITSTTGAFSAFTITLSESGTFKFVFRRTDSATITETIKLQIEKGSTATAYEPFFGGIPSLDYPVPIHSVSGDNTVTVYGFNLWDEQWEVGGLYNASGLPWNTTDRIRSKNFIPITPNTTYYNTLGSFNSLCYYDRNKTYISGGAVGSTFTSPSNAYYIKFATYSSYGTTYNNDICINVSDTAKNGTYQSYTAQDYPITLPVENYAEIIQEKIAKPSWYTGEWLGTTLYENGIAVTKTYAQGGAGGFWASIKAGTYTLSMTVANSESGNGYRLYVSYNNGGTTEVIVRNVAVPLVGNQLIYTFDLPIDSEVAIRPTPSTFNTGYTETDFVDIQLEKGSKVNTYQPYGTTPIEMNKIGSYIDYFVKKNDGWYLHKEIAEVDLGTLSWAYNSQYLMFYANVNDQVNVSNEKVGLCTDYASVTYWISNTEWANNDKIMNNYGGSDRTVRIKDTEYTDATSFKTAMDGVILYYALATPTETLIEDNTLIDQLDAIAEATSYKGSTNIAQTNNDLPFNLDVTAMISGTLTAEHNAEPIITVNSTGSLYVNGNYLKVLSAPITINSKTMQAYSGNVLKNNDVEGDFPLFNEGENEVSSDVDLSIIPNYWEL